MTSQTLTGWFLPEHHWASDMSMDGEIIERPERIPWQHDSHVQAWSKEIDRKAGAVLEYLQIQRWEKDHH